MAPVRNTIKLPKQSLLKMGICAVIIVAVVGLLILPNILRDKEVKREILMLQADLERQRYLFPIYSKLKAQLESKVVEQLPMPEPTALTESEIDTATHAIEDVAIKSNMRINDVTPDPGSLIKSTGYVGVTCEIYGSHFNFRSFLMSLGNLSYLRHIEKIEMQEGADGVNYSLRLQLAVKTG